MAHKTNPQVALMMAQAQLSAAQVAMAQAHRDCEMGRITKVECGRILAKQTRLETKVFFARAELQGRTFEYRA